MLADKQLIGDTQAWVSLVDRYGGNGLALKIVGETIRQVFGGDIVGVPGRRDRQLRRRVRRYPPPAGRQIERLSAVERDVLTRLAVEREPVSLAELSRTMAPSVGRGVRSSRRSRRCGGGRWWSEATSGATFTLQSWCSST